MRTVGRRHGLADTWLNDQATTAIPRAADARAETLYQSSHLTVTGASARHLLAMKLLAAREQDEEAIQIYRELFPEEHVKSRARALVEAAFRNRSVEYER